MTMMIILNMTKINNREHDETDANHEHDQHEENLRTIKNKTNQ